MRNRLTITKTTTALATSALLVLGLAACGGSGDDASTDTETTATEETTPAEEESSASEEPAEEETGDAEASGDFCTAYETLIDAQSSLGSIDASDPAAGVAEFETFTAALEAAEAPAEISGDWDKVTGVFRQLTDTLKTAVDDPASADMSAITSVMSDQEFTTSVQNVAVYGTQNC
ncbi:hypothetical protein [Cellulosimicrobium protaetiae]|uniref:Lipoprotein n=1 Tax=Cellulosimicrobium protaetiae TaxID=2587808 RepID=A0A6M5UKQ6_9MICO|nr:hypothetical protein [Cellulosimicrobium protaetiae]QJW37811.1 hypothetical protein FIC82_018175 [Cellulosimicrobium protaetiae]